MATKTEATGEGVSKDKKAVSKRKGGGSGGTPSQAVEPKKRARYDAPEIEQGLIAMAEANGCATHAADELAEGGLKVAASTLSRWANRDYPERYERVCSDVLPKVRERAAQAHMALAARQMEVERQMAERLEEQVGEIPARDMPGAMRNVATSIGIHTDKAALFAGQGAPQPAQNFGGMLREFKELTGIDIKLSVPEEEEQVQDAEVVEGDA